MANDLAGVKRFFAKHDTSIASTGIAVVGGASVLAGIVYLVQRQIQQGDVLSVRLVHDVEPDTRLLVEQYLPILEKLSEQGMDVNMALFRKRDSE